jgi:hypothetical protein
MPGTRVWTKTKGHWPKGTLRNAWTRGGWESMRSRVGYLLRDHPKPKVRSLAALAAVLDVDKRTVHRWLKGEDHPPESIRPRLSAWLAEQRKSIHRERLS